MVDYVSQLEDIDAEHCQQTKRQTELRAMGSYFGKELKGNHLNNVQKPDNGVYFKFSFDYE